MVLGATTQKLSLCPYICLSNGGRQILVDKLVEVAIQNRVGAGYGIIGAMILHHLVGVQDVAAYLIAPIRERYARLVFLPILPLSFSIQPQSVGPARFA